MKIPTYKSSLPEFNGSSATIFKDKPGATKWQPLSCGYGYVTIFR